MSGQPQLDAATLLHVARLLEARLEAVVTYGAGGCPACHDAELRGAIVAIQRLAAPAAGPTAVATASAGQRTGRRRG